MARELSPLALKKIHFEQNVEKYTQYWVGFLQGILSSGKIEELEVEPLKAICSDFLIKFNDPDANDLLQDLDAWPDDANETTEFINDIIVERTGGIDEILDKKFVPESFFFGYLKGIACDNQIGIEELQGLIELGVADPELAKNDPRINEALTFSRFAIEDLQITAEENDEICQYISRVVGDSFADTGIGLPDDRPVLEGMCHNLSEVDFMDKNFVLTGSFSLPKKVLGRAIKIKGGHVLNNITKSTDYLVMASKGSENYQTPNAGTKIKAAIKNRDKHGRLKFVLETTLKPILE